MNTENQFLSASQQFGIVATAQGFNRPSETLSSLLGMQADDLAKAEDALRGALHRLRGSRPEAINNSLQAGGPTNVPSLTERLSANARAARSVTAMAGELASLLTE